MNNSEIKIIEHFGVKVADVSDLRKGDTVIYNESLRTIGRSDLLFHGFMGVRLFGDSSIKTIEIVKI